MKDQNIGIKVGFLMLGWNLITDLLVMTIKYILFS